MYYNINMEIIIHPHAKERLFERGANEDEIITTIKMGERFPAKFNRIGFRHNFTFNNHWKGKYFNTKQLEVFAVHENDNLVVITVITKYF